jgi:hypothetical protein
MVLTAAPALEKPPAGQADNEPEIPLIKEFACQVLIALGQRATLGAGLLGGAHPTPGQALSAVGAGLSGGRWLATTPEQPAQETAAALGPLDQLALQILDL